MLIFSISPSAKASHSLQEKSSFSQRLLKLHWFITECYKFLWSIIEHFTAHLMKCIICISRNTELFINTVTDCQLSLQTLKISFDLPRVEPFRKFMHLTCFSQNTTRNIVNEQAPNGYFCRNV